MSDLSATSPPLQRTWWRGLGVRHPSDWEFSTASAAEAAPVCGFSDRYYQRIELRWRELDYEPNLTMVIQKFQQEETQSEGRRPKRLSQAPEGWEGVVHRMGPGRLVQAVRFLRERKWLVELRLVWPEARDKGLEWEILDSVRGWDESEPIQRWDAMGMRLDVPRDFRLSRWEASVGKVAWEFEKKGSKRRDAASLSASRLAMPKYWLKGAVGDWLASTLPKSQRVLGRRETHAQSHAGCALTSVFRRSNLHAFLGMSCLQLDVAWHCSTDERVLHLSYRDSARLREIALPEGTRLHCCRLGGNHAD